MRDDAARVAIVDYGLGNLYSVQRACEHVGLSAAITAAPDEVLRADGVILPGVGAMPTAMERLRESGLASALAECASRGTPLFGICLGLQLLMKNGSEFGPHPGLGLVEGDVVRFEGTDAAGAPLKVPHIGWNAIAPARDSARDPARGSAARWADTPLEDLEAGSMMYFVHSYYVVPSDASVCVATTRYGSVEFCAALVSGNIFACQFHPERSGPVGLSVYAQFARRITHLATRS